MASGNEWGEKDGKIVLVNPKTIQVREAGLHVAMHIAWSRRTWKQSLGDHQTLQIAIPPHIAREVAEALLRSADEAEAGTGHT